LTTKGEVIDIWLQVRMYLLMGVLFAIVYSVAVVLLPGGTFVFYGVLASFFLFLQYLIGPSIVKWSMGIKYVSEQEAPDLHRMVEELSREAGIKKPKIGVSSRPIPNAFAYGNFLTGGHVCVTEQIMKLLSREELRAVLGHEVSHLKNRDVAVITALSVIPTVMWYIAWSTIWSRGGRDRGNQVVIGVVAFLLYFITNLLVLYGSRIREYYADQGSVKLGNAPHYLASALYKLVYGSAKTPHDTLKAVEGYKAFFLNDPSQAMHEFNELKQIDADLSGTIDHLELMSIRTKKVKLGTSDKFMEMLSSHPNMLKRIKHLSTLVPYQIS
jgi:heat shock protein HtpX